MSRNKFRMAVTALVLLCLTAAVKADFWPTGGHTNDWTVISNWIENGEPAARLPAGADGIYMNTASPDNPMAVLAGDTGSCYWMYIANEIDDTNGDRLDIYGTLNLYNPAIDPMVATPGFLIFGNQGDDTAAAAQSAIVTIHPGGFLETGEIWTSVTKDAAHINYMVQDGGTVKADFMLSTLYNYYDSKLEYQLNGGTLFLGKGNYVHPSYVLGTTSDYLTIDIAGGTLVMPEACLAADIAGGVILANGSTVVNPDSELYIDTITYRDVIWRGANRNLVAVSNGIGGPNNAADLYVSQWTMDDNAADTTVTDSTAGNDGVFSDVTGNPNTTAHHSADAMEGTGSLQFDGIDDYVALPRNAVLETGNPYSESSMLSVSAWIKHDTSSDNNATIMGTGTGGWFLGTLGTADTISFVCSLADPNGLAFETVTLTDTTPVFDGQWHHVVAAFNGAELNLYVDDSRTTSETTLQAARIENGGDTPVLIGRDAGTTDSYWKGLIDDVRIYQFALNSEEVYHWHHPTCAWNPNYPNGAWWVDPNNAVLEWSAGDGADSHDVYFGKKLAADIDNNDAACAVNVEDLKLLASGWLTDSDGSGLAEPKDIVDFADFAVMADEWQQTSLVFQGNTTDPNFVAATDTSPLDSQAIYYWRIDEVDDDTAATCTGRVWGFTTE